MQDVKGTLARINAEPRSHGATEQRWSAALAVVDAEANAKAIEVQLRQLTATLLKVMGGGRPADIPLQERLKRWIAR